MTPLDQGILDEITLSNNYATWARQSSNATSFAFTVYLFVLGFHERLHSSHSVVLLALPVAIFACALTDGTAALLQYVDRGGSSQAYIASGILWICILCVSFVGAVATEISMLLHKNPIWIRRRDGETQCANVRAAYTTTSSSIAVRPAVLLRSANGR